MLVEEGRKFNFNYGTFDQDDSLDVAAEIWDNSSSIPGSLLAVVGLTHVSNGGYVGEYLAGSNKKYSIIIGVYTDNTYSTIVNERPISVSERQTFKASTDVSVTVVSGGENIAVNDDDENFATEEEQDDFAVNDDENETI